MPKTAHLTELEHRIETLPPTDQLKLLEKIVKHLKNSFRRDQSTELRKTAVSGEVATARGLLKQYADPVLRKQEKEGFLSVMKEKHAPR